MSLAGRRLVVTGGAGFIGSHLVDRLLADGARVVVVDDFSSGRPVNLSRHAGRPELTVVRADIRDAHAVADALAGADMVFHLACRNVRLSLHRPTEVHDVNATGTLNVLKAAAGAGVSRFLYVSSSEVNGTADIVPMPETYHFRPETIYGASKLAGEYYTQVFERAGWLRTVIARPHNNYGPREHYRGVLGEVIPRFILQVLSGKRPTVFGDGRQTRDFTYVTETADCLVALMEHEVAMGGVFNVCRGEEVSILDIARAVAALSGRDLPPEFLPGRPSDVLRLYGDPSRLRALLGRSPAIGIREGLASTFAWFAANVPAGPEREAALAPANWEDCEPEAWLAARGGRP